MKHHVTQRILMLVLSVCMFLSIRETPALDLNPAVVTVSEYTVTTFADSLDFPLGMTALADGSILIACNAPQGGGQSFYNSQGVLIRLADADENGVADDSGSILFSGLPGGVTGVERLDNHIFVISTESNSQQIAILRTGATPSSSLILEGTVSFPISSSYHVPSALAVHRISDSPDVVQVFFQMGSDQNAAAPTRSVSVTSDIGLASTSPLTDAGIYAFKVDFSEDTPVGSDLELIATGIRNAAGMAFHPDTGALFFQENGIDGLVDANEPTSPDEINSIGASNIGGTVEDFGFPSTYSEYRTGNSVGSTGIPPIVEFYPIPDPADGYESEGAVNIRFAPATFPTGFNDGLFVGFHGKFTAAGAANEENPVIYVDLDSGTYTHFILPTDPEIGHPNGLLATDDALYIADFASNGSPFSGGGTGRIYKVRSNATAGINNHPDNSQIVTSRSASLTVGTFGTIASYQWYAGESGDTTTPVAGATGSTLKTGLLAEGEHTFWLRADDGTTTFDSRTATVTVTETPFSKWQVDHFVEGDLTDGSNENTIFGVLANPDGDSWNNLFEYALGCIPTDSSDSNEGMQITTAQAGGSTFLTMRVRQRRDAEARGLSYTIEVSGDNTTWSSDSGDVELTSTTVIDDDFAWMLYKDTTAVTSNAPRLIRLIVDLASE